MPDMPLQTVLPARPLRWWDLAVPLLSGVAVFALITSGLVAVALSHGGAGAIEDIARKLQSAEQGYALNMAVMAALYVPPLAVMLWIARRKHVEFFRSVPRRLILWAFAGGIAYAVAFQLLQDLLIRLSVVSFTPSPAELMLVPHNVAQLALGLGLAALLGPFVEEFYFRGFLLSWCRGKMRILLATLINAALFGFIHFYFVAHPGLEGLFVTGVIGLFGALNVWWTVRAGSLWPAFASHAAYNGAGMLLMFLFPNV